MLQLRSARSMPAEQGETHSINPLDLMSRLLAGGVSCQCGGRAHQKTSCDYEPTHWLPMVFAI